MKSNDAKVIAEIKDVLFSQRLAVLSTQRSGQPYASLMAFAPASDLATIYVATGSATRKYVNLIQESRVSLLIDTRNNCEADFHAAAAVTVVGKASPVEPENSDPCRNLYLKRHPYLVQFTTLPTTVFFEIEVHHYILVNQFQNVIEYHLSDAKHLFT